MTRELNPLGKKKLVFTVRSTWNT